LATTLAKGVLFHHYCLAAGAEFRDGLPQSGQGVLGLFDALTLTADVAGVGGDAIFQTGDGIFALVAELCRQSAEQLCAQAVEWICALTDMPSLYPLDSDFYNQMAIAPLPSSADLTSLKARLYDEYQVEVPLIQWQDRKFVRVSIQGYNTPSDVDAFLEALGEIL